MEPALVATLPPYHRLQAATANKVSAAAAELNSQLRTFQALIASILSYQHDPITTLLHLPDSQAVF